MEKEESDGWLRLRTITGADDYTPEETARHKLPVIIFIACFFFSPVIYVFTTSLLKLQCLFTKLFSEHLFIFIDEASRLRRR